MIRLRKQNDDVKLIVLFFLAGAVFLASAIYHGLKFYQTVNTPVEYVVSYAAGSTLSNVRLEELRQSEKVSAVSRQAEKTVSVKYNTEEFVISYIELSDTYIDSVYGIEESSSMKTFYINGPAYEQLRQNMQSNQGGTGIHEAEFRISYDLSCDRINSQAQQTNGNHASDTEYGTARVVVLEDDIPEAEPYIFCRGSDMNLSEDAVRVRVRFEQMDLDGMNRRRMERLGFVVENENVLLESEYSLELELMKARYNILLAVICMGCVGILAKRAAVRIS